jgi:hypothetical protein
MTNNRRDTAAALALALLAATLLAGNADAQRNLTANGMVPPCKDFIASGEKRQEVNVATAIEQGVCIGIIVALTGVATDLPPRISWCRPQGVTLGQTARVILAYIERRPQRMHEDFVALAAEALHEAWPCN